MAHPAHGGIAALALLAAASSWAQQPAPAQAPDTGFFKPAADPALTAWRPAPAAPPSAPPAAQPASTPTQPTEELALAEEQMDRAETDHALARAEAAPRRPAIISPLDGTAPILSPLDGTAPILSPVTR